MRTGGWQYLKKSVKKGSNPNNLKEVKLALDDDPARTEVGRVTGIIMDYPADTYNPEVLPYQQDWHHFSGGHVKGRGASNCCVTLVDCDVFKETETEVGRRWPIYDKVYNNEVPYHHHHPQDMDMFKDDPAIKTELGGWPIYDYPDHHPQGSSR